MLFQNVYNVEHLKYNKFMLTKLKQTHAPQIPKGMNFFINIIVTMPIYTRDINYTMSL